VFDKTTNDPEQCDSGTQATTASVITAR
jgi:hypothetical protein